MQLINMLEELNVQCLKVLLMALGSWLHFARVFFIDEICVIKYVHTEFEECLNSFWIRNFIYVIILQVIFSLQAMAVVIGVDGS